ncbi:MAG: hypothetical protein WCI95_12555 [bacterium]
MKYAMLIFGGLILASILCFAEAGKKPRQEHWVIDGAPAEWTGDTMASRDVTNHYCWIPADFLYTCPKETLINSNGQAVFTKHDKTRTDFAGPISSPTPQGYTSNMTFRWYTYHTSTGTYAMACRWRAGGLKAWTCATSGLFQAGTSLTNLSTAALTSYVPAPDDCLIDMEYWVIPTNAPGGGTAGGIGYVRGMRFEYEARF